MDKERNENEFKLVEEWVGAAGVCCSISPHR